MDEDVFVPQARDLLQQMQELGPTDYSRLQKRWVTQNQLTTNSEVMVAVRGKSYFLGWPNTWTSAMDSVVGKVLQVVKIQDYGILLSDGYSYPFYVLDVVEPAKPVPIKLRLPL